MVGACDSHQYKEILYAVSQIIKVMVSRNVCLFHGMIDKLVKDLTSAY